MIRAIRVGSVGAMLLSFSSMSFAQDQALAEAGQAVYSEHCAECHGEELRSAGSIPDLRRLQADERSHFNEVVTEGRGQMPAWGGVLQDSAFDQLWAYIRAHAIDR
jgi:mono/diheme cytochrome c family protein